ncbi:type II toxin-antitoxin system RelE/ParE family toxin [bacterium]|nr:type II toxin-antitoxin system RelE/ParE family toxin [bacterium]
MLIRFLEIAQIELDQAIEYYNHESPGLGKDFLTEVLNTLNRIGEFPYVWHRLSERTRRCQTKRFPYGIIYYVRNKEILIVAVANLHRRPGFWNDRIKQQNNRFNPDR